MQQVSVGIVSHPPSWTKLSSMIYILVRPPVKVVCWPDAEWSAAYIMSIRNNWSETGVICECYIYIVCLQLMISFWSSNMAYIGIAVRASCCNLHLGSVSTLSLCKCGVLFEIVCLDLLRVVKVEKLIFYVSLLLWNHDCMKSARILDVINVISTPKIADITLTWLGHGTRLSWA